MFDMADIGKGDAMSVTLHNRTATHSMRRQFLMDAQHKVEIGLRIKELRDNSPETNRSIADYVGVGERSVAHWMAGGGITYENAEKVAELFNVTISYIWRGWEQPETPDLMGVLSEAPSTEALIAEIRENRALGVELLAEMAQLRSELATVLAHLRPSTRSGRG